MYYKWKCFYAQHNEPTVFDLFAYSSLEKTSLEKKTNLNVM